MGVWVSLVRAVSLLLVGLYAGGVFFTAIAPSVQRLPGEAYVRYWQAENRDYARAMPALVLGGLVATLAAAVLERARGFMVVGWTLLVVVLIVGTIVVTLALLEPLNRAANAWDPDSLPSDWEMARTRWLRWHLLRTFLAVLAFLSLLVARVIDQ